MKKTEEIKKPKEEKKDKEKEIIKLKKNLNSINERYNKTNNTIIEVIMEDDDKKEDEKKSQKENIDIGVKNIKKNHQLIKINDPNTNSININIESKGKLPIITNPEKDKKKNKRNNLSNPKMENQYLLTGGWKNMPKIDKINKKK